MAQSVKHPTSAQVMSSQFAGLSPMSSSVLTAQSLKPASDSVPPPLSAPLPLVLSLSLSLSLSHSLSEGYRYAVLKGHMHPNVYSSTIDNSQSMERAQMSIDGRMDKEDVVYIYTMEYYSAIKKNEILPFATMWMEQEGIMLSKISQSEKEKYHTASLI